MAKQQLNTSQTKTVLGGLATLGSTFTTTSSAVVQITNMSVSVTVPAGKSAKATLIARDQFNSTSGQYTSITLWRGAVNSGTLIGQNFSNHPSGLATGGICIGIDNNPGAGTYTYTAGLNSPGGSGTAQLETGSVSMLFLIEIV